MNKVVYASRKGNTKKLADAIAKGLGVSAEAVGGDTPPSGADILFIGASIYAGEIDPGMKAYLSRLEAGCADRAAVFGTAAGSKSARDQIAAILEGKGIPVEGEAFFCKGSFLFANRGRPDIRDCEQAAAFAQRIAQGG